MISSRPLSDILVSFFDSGTYENVVSVFMLFEIVESKSRDVGSVSNWLFFIAALRKESADVCFVLNCFCLLFSLTGISATWLFRSTEKHIMKIITM